MATITAPTAAHETGESPPPAITLRHLWQAPVFIAGVAALLAVWLARSPSAPNVFAEADHGLSAARAALGRSDADPTDAVRLASHAVEAAQSAPDRLGEAHLLLGTAYLRQADAESGPAPPLSLEHYRLARQHLEQAMALGVPDEEQGRLRYRLGKACIILKDYSPHVAENLAAGVEHAEDRVEGYRLLTEAYLRQDPPNIKEAFKANERLRQDLPQVDPHILDAAKLQAGEMLMKLNKPDQARKVLEKIADQASPNVLLKARLLRARTYQDEGKWKEASELWKAILDDNRVPPPEPGKVLYNLAVCYRGLEEPREAAAVWEDCLRRGKGDEAPASALALAELRLQEADHGQDRALEMLTRAMERVSQPADWKNSLTDLKEARDVFERVSSRYREAQRFDLAVELTRTYARLALPGRAEGLRAEVFTEWARSHQEQAQAAADLQVRQKEEASAHERFRDAGAAHIESADKSVGQGDQAEHLWQAATCFVQGEAHDRAAAVLERFLQAYQSSQRQGEGWYQLAQSYRHLNHEDAARKAYLKCIEFPTAFAYRAQYHLALEAIKNNQTDRAEEILRKNLQDMTHADADPEAQEKTLFALGHLLYQRNTFGQAKDYLEQALTRFPGNADASRARYELADSCRMLANQEQSNYIHDTKVSEDAKRHFMEEHRRLLRKAADEFLELAEFLQTPQAKGHLTPEEQVRVPFLAEDCLFNLGDYDKALQQCARLADRFRNDPANHMLALERMARIYAAVSDWEKLRQQLANMKAVVVSLPAMAQAPWTNWLQEAQENVEYTQAAQRWARLHAEWEHNRKKGPEPQRPVPPRRTPGAGPSPTP